MSLCVCWYKSNNLVCAVPATTPIITANGGETVYHKVNTSYVDAGATATVMSADSVLEQVPVKTVLNTVPSPLGERSFLCFILKCYSTIQTD